MLYHELHQRISQAAARAWELNVSDLEFEVSRPTDASFGDVTTNIAMIAARRLGRPPRALAEQLLEQLKELDEIESLAVAGPGFINIFLTGASISRAALLVLDDHPTFMQGQTVLVEYSDPNPFKPLHAGHLYTTLVGDMVANLVTRQGGKIIRLNYSGDVGLHVARCMWGILHELGGEHFDQLATVPPELRPEWLGRQYVAGTAAYEHDPTAKAEIVALNQRVYELHNSGDHSSEFAKIYWQCRAWSYDYFMKLYAELEVTAFDRFIPESEVANLGIFTVQQQLERGVYARSDGAVVFHGEAMGLHTRVFINSAGLPTYETKDVGLLLTKWRDYRFDRSIVVTANEQAQYMEVMLKSVEQFEPEPAQRSLHITHGVVKLRGGVKMSSRTGNVVSALDILQSARLAGQAGGLATRESAILGAVKFAFAKTRIGGDIEYDPVESVAMEGKSGPYLQYAHARARGILRGIAQPQPGGSQASELVFEAGERTLALKIAQYSEVIEQACRELMPHVICTYLYELAQTFNRFYEANRVVGHERQQQRATLVSQYADVLADGLSILGIQAPHSV